MLIKIIVFIGGLLVGLLSGFIASLLANAHSERFNSWYAKTLKKWNVCGIFAIITKKWPNNVLYDTIICNKVNGDDFSTLAVDYMKKNKHDHVIIANIQEPCWFYSNFKEWAANKDIRKKHTRICECLDGYENAFVSDPPNIDEANKYLKEICNIFYTGKKNIPLWPHLKQFYNLEAKEKSRVNFFELNLDCTESIDEFKKHNKKHHVYFFQHFISYKTTKSLFCSKGEEGYEGTDAIVLNKSFVLNHDESILELCAYQDDLAKERDSGFLKYLTNLCSGSGCYETADILRRYDLPSDILNFD